MAQQHTTADVVDQRPAGAANHLQHVRHGVVNVAVLSTVEMLRVHQDHQVGRQREAPAQRVHAYKNLHGTRCVQSTNGRVLRGGEPLVQKRDAVSESVREGTVVDPREIWRDVIGIGVQEAVRLAISGRVSEDVDRGQLRLFRRRHENDRRPGQNTGATETLAVDACAKGRVYSGGVTLTDLLHD